MPNDSVRAYLNNSRIQAAIGQVENNEDVDWAKLGKLQTLDLARVGELFLLEALEREDIADASLEPKFID